MPETYRNLIEFDITDDYTMGYAAQPGFRASTCSSFNFYDLDREQETKLRVHPFCIMDASLRHYLNVDVNIYKFEFKISIRKLFVKL